MLEANEQPPQQLPGYLGAKYPRSPLRAMTLESSARTFTGLVQERAYGGYVFRGEITQYGSPARSAPRPGYNCGRSPSPCREK